MILTKALSHLLSVDVERMGEPQFIGLFFDDGPRSRFDIPDVLISVATGWGLTGHFAELRVMWISTPGAISSVTVTSGTLAGPPARHISNPQQHFYQNSLRIIPSAPRRINLPNDWQSITLNASGTLVGGSPIIPDRLTVIR